MSRKPFIDSLSTFSIEEYPASAKSTAGCSGNGPLPECAEGRLIANDTVGAPAYPGHGSPVPGCGERIQYRRCSSCGLQWWVERSCMMRECPRCYEKWAFREARKASVRMWTSSKRRCYDQMWPWHKCRIVHVVVSFPDRGEGIEQARREAYDLSRHHNLDGGLAIPHPFDKPGFIKFHMIALAHGDILPGGTDGDAFFKVVVDKEYGNYRGIRSPVGIRRCLMYLLSHCGIYEGRHAVTWWGSLSYNRLSSDLLRKSYPEAWRALEIVPDVCCPRCGCLDTYEILSDGSVDPGGAARWCRSHYRYREEVIE